jgi:hypothetical protein
LAVVGTLAFATACAPDETAGPERQGVTLPVGIQPSHIDVTSIQGALECLYGASVIPSPQSALSKLNSLVTALHSDDYETAVSSYQDLVAFLENWATNTNTNATAPLECAGVDTTPFATPTTVGGWFDYALAASEALWAGEDGEVCVLDAAGGSCIDEDENLEDGKSKVTFPANILGQLTAVYIENNPERTDPNFTQLQDQLDEYPTYVRIVTYPVNDFSDDNIYPVKPLVVVCYKPSLLALLQANPSLGNRLLLGSLHDGTEFKLLERAAEAEINGFCGDPSTSAPALSLFPNTGFGRVANRAANFLMPAPLSASSFFSLNFGGAGGSAEEFSEFGAVDPGISFGGAGGSAEEFAPRAMPGAAASGPAAATVEGYVYKGDLEEEISGANGPRVRIVTPSGTPIPNVSVVFELVPPVSSSPESQASLCGGSPQTVVTDADGYAAPGCVDFGPTPGYKNLKATFDPTQVDDLACMVDAGTCVPGAEASVFFGIESFEPPAEFACTAGTKLGKVNFASYNSSTGKWTGYFSIKDITAPLYSGRIRQVTVGMSLTGRSSSTSAFVVTLTASVEGTPIASGTTATGQLNLPGDNGAPVNVTFRMNPTAALGTGQTALFRMEVAAPSTRAPQLWYRTDRFTGDDCLNSIAYADGTQPPAATLKQTIAGLVINVNNTVWTP